MTQTGEPVEKIVNIPDRNTAFLLLGRGSSITDMAVRLLAESNVSVGFCGSGGSPLLAAVDYAFLTPQDEYRPTEYLQGWVAQWFDEPKRLALGRQFLTFRSEQVERYCAKTVGIDMSALAADFHSRIAAAPDVTHLLAAEAWYAKHYYRIFADHHRVAFVREHEGNSEEKGAALINSFLSHGNYLAYGYAAAALHVLGIPYGLPVLHGKTRRGALVFDVADLFKDWLVIPLAFEAGANGWKRGRFRAALIEQAMRSNLLDTIIPFIQERCAQGLKNQSVTNPSENEGF
jgi:CRISPR-associated protein Cas1